MTDTAPAPAPTPMPALSFDLGYLDIDQKTARMQLPMVTPDAYLELRPAHEANAAYHEASVAMSGDRVRGVATGAVPADRANSDADRNDDRQLYPLHVVVGWGGIVDTSNNPVPFSVAACAKFMQALPDWLFDRIRIFAMRPERFITTPPSADVTAKNS